MSIIEKPFAGIDQILAHASESGSRRRKKATPTDPAKPITDRDRLVERARKAIDRWLLVGEYYAATTTAMEDEEVGPGGFVPTEWDFEQAAQAAWKAHDAAVAAIKKATPRRAGLKYPSPAAIIDAPKWIDGHAIRHGRFLYIVTRPGELGSISIVPLDLCWLD
jgi:hypothetical protein